MHDASGLFSGFFPQSTVRAPLSFPRIRLAAPSDKRLGDIARLWDRRYGIFEKRGTMLASYRTFKWLLPPSKSNAFNRKDFPRLHMAETGAGIWSTGRGLFAALGCRPVREPFQRVLKRRCFNNLFFADPEILVGTFDVVYSVTAHTVFHISCEAKYGEPGGVRVLCLPGGGVSGKAFRVAWHCYGRRRRGAKACAPRESFSEPP